MKFPSTAILIWIIVVFTGCGSETAVDPLDGFSHEYLSNKLNVKTNGIPKAQKINKITKNLLLGDFIRENPGTEFILEGDAKILKTVFKENRVVFIVSINDFASTKVKSINYDYKGRFLNENTLYKTENRAIVNLVINKLGKGILVINTIRDDSRDGPPVTMAIRRHAEKQIKRHLFSNRIKFLFMENENVVSPIFEVDNLNSRDVIERNVEKIVKRAGGFDIVWSKRILFSKGKLLNRVKRIFVSNVSTSGEIKSREISSGNFSDSMVFRKSIFLLIRSLSGSYSLYRYGDGELSEMKLRFITNEEPFPEFLSIHPGIIKFLQMSRGSNSDCFLTISTLEYDAPFKLISVEKENSKYILNKSCNSYLYLPQAITESQSDDRILDVNSISGRGYVSIEPKNYKFRQIKSLRNIRGRINSVMQVNFKNQNYVFVVIQDEDRVKLKLSDS